MLNGFFHGTFTGPIIDAVKSTTEQSIDFLVLNKSSISQQTVKGTFPLGSEDLVEIIGAACIWILLSFPMFLHMKLSELSVKFKTFFPSLVSVYTFRGLSAVMFQVLLR